MYYMSRSRSAKANEKLTVEKAAGMVKDAAGNVREAAAATRETVKALRDSGAIEEIAGAAREAAMAARDTTVEIRDAAKDVNKTVADTTSVAKETAAVAQETVRLVTKELPKPKTTGRKKSRARKPTAAKMVKSTSRKLRRQAVKTRKQIKIKAAKKKSSRKRS
jgi:hypothetical protein